MYYDWSGPRSNFPRKRSVTLYHLQSKSLKNNGLNLFGMQQDKLSNIRGFETEDYDVALAARSPRRVLMHFIGLGVSVFYVIPGELGWRSGESARLPPMWPGFDSSSV